MTNMPALKNFVTSLGEFAAKIPGIIDAMGPLGGTLQLQLLADLLDFANKLPPSVLGPLADGSSWCSLRSRWAPLSTPR